MVVDVDRQLSLILPMYHEDPELAMSQNMGETVQNHLYENVAILFLS